MDRIILADNQLIFRAGAARVLSRAADMPLVTECDDAARLMSAVLCYPGSIVFFASSLGSGMGELLPQIQRHQSRAVLIHENGETIRQETAEKLHGILSRGAAETELLDCIRLVARGERSLPAGYGRDSVAARVRQQLTAKEMQIVRLIVEGCKNKEIGRRMGVKEQGIKNYLRSIYDKTGVSDRLELALFTIHHRILNDAA